MPVVLPEWLEKRDVVHFHSLLIEEHGGLHGIRDEGALESTLACPKQLLHYREDVSIFELAASYGHGFAKNHVFRDGNKRISLASIDYRSKTSLPGRSLHLGTSEGQGISPPGASALIARLLKKVALIVLTMNAAMVGIALSAPR